MFRLVRSPELVEDEAFAGVRLKRRNPTTKELVEEFPHLPPVVLACNKTGWS